MDIHPELLLCLKAAETQGAEQWFTQEFANHPPPIYGSMDIRYAGDKIAVIDHNIFPAGFNNLSSLHLAAIPELLQKQCQQLGAIRTIGLICESHDRNRGYWLNVQTLFMLLQQAGFATTLLVLENIENVQIFVKSLQLPFTPFLLQPGTYVGSTQVPTVHATKQTFDLLLCNNDLSSGCPPVLATSATTITPNPQAGWHKRSKYAYFILLEQVIKELCAYIDFPYSHRLYAHNVLCSGVDLHSLEGTHKLQNIGTQFFQELKQYAHAPYIVAKVDHGTYGMGVLSIHNVEDLQHINRSFRKKLSTSKGGGDVTQILFQEGVPTIVSYEGAKAENTLYTIGKDVVGGFLRYHSDRNETGILNAPGALYGQLHIPVDTDPVFSLHLFMSKIALVTAGRELAVL